MPISPGFHQGFTRAGYQARVRLNDPTLTATENNMLVLTRKLGESIHIGDGVVVTVLDVRPGRIRLAIVAPLSVRIRREEQRGASENRTMADFLAGQPLEESKKNSN